MRELNCQRCGGQMQFIKQEKIQLGQTGVFLGDWPNIWAGALEVEIYGCPNCGKLEFYIPGVSPKNQEPDFDLEDLPPDANENIVGVSRDGVPQVRCPNCGKTHDFDYPKCIYCDFDYYK